MEGGPKSAATARADREIQHGRFLASSDPEWVWGWGTPAGRLRASRRAALIAAGADLRSGTLALEVGCGTGLFTGMFASSGARILAVDISADLLERARARGLPQDQVRFLHARFEDCVLEGPFDAVIGNSILHHLDLHETLPKLHALLKPGGWMAFAEPNLLNPQIALQKNVPWIKRRLGESPDETAFIRWSFSRALKRAGFEDVMITPFDWLHPATPAALIPIVGGIGAALERLPLMREFAGSLLIRGRRRTSSPA